MKQRKADPSRRGTGPLVKKVLRQQNGIRDLWPADKTRIEEHPNEDDADEDHPKEKLGFFWKHIFLGPLESYIILCVRKSKAFSNLDLLLFGVDLTQFWQDGTHLSRFVSSSRIPFVLFCFFFGSRLFSPRIPASSTLKMRIHEGKWSKMISQCL